MSTLLDQFRNHQVHTTLANLKETLNDENLEEILQSDADDQYQRIQNLTLYTEQLLDNVLTDLVQQSTLNNVNSGLQSVLNEINQYIGNKNIGHISNAANHVDNTLNSLAQLPIPRPNLQEDAFTKSALRFREHTESIISKLESEKDRISENLTQINSDSESAKSSLDEIVVSISDARTEISTALEEYNLSLEELKNSYDEQYSAVVESQDSKFETLFTNKQESFDTLTTNFKERLDATIKDSNEKTESILSSLEQKRTEASNLVQIIGNIGVTGNYQNLAIQEKKAADFWRAISVLLMLIMIGVIAYTVFLSMADGFDWKIAIFRLSAAVLLLIPATYCAQESGKHRRNETINRKMELELAAIDPFLESLPNEQKQAAKLELTKRFFGNEVSIPEAKDIVSSKDLLALVKAALKGN